MDFGVWHDLLEFITWPYLSVRVYTSIYITALLGSTVLFALVCPDGSGRFRHDHSVFQRWFSMCDMTS